MARDMYGFALLTSQEDTVAQRSLDAAWAAAKKTANAWKGVDVELVRSNEPLTIDPKRFQSLKHLVRKGIPYELRACQWHHMSGAAAHQAAAGPGYYASLAQIKALSVNSLLTLNEELSPGIFMFRTHSLFKKQDGMDAVRRLLCAYVQRNPAGYFRGLAHIAGFLLIVMGLENEEHAFWVLTTLLEDKLFSYCPGQAAYGLKVELRTLELLVQKKLPTVAAHLDKLDTTTSCITPTWFSNLFTTTLPAEVTARVFDCLLLEGNKVLHRVALALMRTYQASICAASHPTQLRKVLESRAARLYDVEALMTMAFKGVGAMPTSSIQVMRTAAAAVVDAQIEEHRQRLELITRCRTH